MTYADASGTAITGLSDATTYFVIKVDNDTIKLATNLTNANAGTAITLSGTGNNSQTLTGVTATATATVAGGVVTGFSVTEVGSDYTAAPTVTVDVPRRTIPTSGVTTGTDTIAYTSHGLSVNDQVRYQDGGGTAITGLTDNTTYFVKAVADANSFTLSATEGGSVIDLTGTGNNAQFFELLSATQQLLGLRWVLVLLVTKVQVLLTLVGFVVRNLLVLMLVEYSTKFLSPCPRMVSLVMPQMILSSLNNRTDQCVDSKLSELTHICAAADSLYLVQSSTSKQITTANLFASAATPVSFVDTVSIGDHETVTAAGELAATKNVHVITNPARVVR